MLLLGRGEVTPLSASLIDAFQTATRGRPEFEKPWAAYASLCSRTPLFLPDSDDEREGATGASKEPSVIPPGSLGYEQTSGASAKVVPDNDLLIYLDSLETAIVRGETGLALERLRSLRRLYLLTL